MRLGNEHAIRLQHLDDAVDDGVHVLDMREEVRRGDDARRRHSRLDLARHLDAEIALDRRNAALVAMSPTSVGSMPSTRWPAS